jgi:glycosyltransferase involved in cell wall biosynthesis
MKDGLKKSIKSLMAQNLKGDIEYIVVDGASTDGSLEIIESYKNNIDKALVEKDNGIFDAMNKGIKLASGEYIYFLNSGDEFASENILKTIVEKIESTKKSYNIISGDVATFKHGKYIGIANLHPWIVHQSAFVKTELMNEYKFDSNFKILGDLDLWKRLHNDGKFKYCKIRKIIANMELDGVGSDPTLIFKRLKDKRYYAKKHRDYSGLLASCIVESAGYLVFKVFNERMSLLFYKNIITNLKKILR